MNQLFPPVTKRLLIANVTLYFLTVILSQNGVDLVDIFGLHSPGSAKFKPWQLITHIFMHGSEMHLFSNMLALWMFGAALENNVWGGKRFFTYFLVTGLGAAGLHLAVTGYNIRQTGQSVEAFEKQPNFEHFQRFLHEVPMAAELRFTTGSGETLTTRMLMEEWGSDKLNPFYRKQGKQIATEIYTEMRDEATVGASGAVFGILLAFGIFFAETYVFIGFLIPLKAKYFVALYGFWELYRGVQNSPFDNVAHFAHLGGMLFGFLLIKYWQSNRKHLI